MLFTNFLILLTYPLVISIICTSLIFESAQICNMCKNFLHRYGNIVAVDENLDIMTLFDVEVDDEYSESHTFYRTVPGSVVILASL